MTKDNNPIPWWQDKYVDPITDEFKITSEQLMMEADGFARGHNFKCFDDIQRHYLLSEYKTHSMLRCNIEMWLENVGREDLIIHDDDRTEDDWK